MGWDVAEIGLNHDLPFDNPLETATIISERMRANVVICVFATKDMHEWDLHKMMKFEFPGTESEYWLEIHGKDLLCKTFNTINRIIEYDNHHYYLDDFDNYNYYVLEDDDIMISIYKEWINLDVCVNERWGWWERCFHKKDDVLIYINNYRKEIFEQAKLFGCNKVAIMSDQGPTDYICSFSSSEKVENLLDYINSYKYLDEYYKDDIEKWTPDDYTHINIPDYLESDTLIPKSQAISVMFDDFRDLKG